MKRSCQSMLRSLRGGAFRAAQVRAAAPAVATTAASRPISSLRNIDVTAKNEDVVELYDSAISGYLRLGGDPYGNLVEAVEKDPEFTMGHASMALFQLLSNVPPSSDDVKQCVDAAHALVGKGKANDRERHYVNAALAWQAEDVRGATAHLEQVMLDNPFDALTLRLLHDTYFMLGDHFNLRNGIARVVPRWTPDLVDYPRVLGMYTFGLEETNAYTEAEEFGMRTLSVDPGDTWAVHALTHVFEMQGRRNEGLRLLRELRDDWQESNMLLCHMHWHWGLFQLDEGDVDMAFSRYDVDLRGEESPFLNNLIDAIGLLWRFELYGCNVESRWADILDKVKVYMHDHAFAFNEPFISMALVGAGDDAAVEEHLESMRAYVAGSPNAEALSTLAATVAHKPLGFTASPWAFAPHHGELDNRGTTAAVGLGVCEGMVAYRRGEYDTAVSKLLPLRPLCQMLGGSHAQRDAIELTLLQAAKQSGKHQQLAVQLLAERTSKRTTQPVVWWWYAEALDAIGDDRAAAEARDRAYSLGLNQGGSHAQ